MNALPAPTLYQALVARAEATPQSPGQWRLDASGGWQPRTWSEMLTEVKAVASGLVRAGLRPDDRLGIFAATSPEWDVVQMAAFAAGAVVVGMDIHEHDERLARLVALAEVSFLVVDDATRLARLPGRDRFKAIFLINGEAAGAHPLSALRTGPEEALPAPTPDAPALIVFTSGTTGEPKGIAYTHRQAMIACEAILDAFPELGEGGRLACWLPLANLFQRMINFCAILRGGQIYYVDNPRAIMAHVATIAPDVFIAVPRFYEKFFAGVQERLATRPAWQRRLFHAALALGRRRVALEQAGRSVPAWLRAALAAADPLLFAPVRAALGGRIRLLVSGSAPMPHWLLLDMAALGLPVYEAYGMSENIVPNCLNRPGAVRFGTVGRPLSPNRLKVAADQEIWVAGPGLFTGYLGEPPAVRDEDGFIATGDYGRLDADGFVTLLGRKSELFKTSTGRRIAPGPIEAALKRIPGVEACMVVGANRPFLTALVWTQPETADALAARLPAEAAQVLAALPDWQRPAGFVLVPRLPSLAAGEITTNLKLRRREAEALHGEAVAALYKGLAADPAQNLVRSTA